MAELPDFDPYRVLGVDKSSDAALIKKAYRKLALLKHPDKCSDETLRSQRTDEFQQLNEAYAILGDDDKRQRHDALVKLDALRKEKASMSAHPRPFARASTFHSSFPTSASTAYTSRGATNVEDRAPRRSSDDDDPIRIPRRFKEFEYTRRSAPPPARERTKSEQEAADRRRDDRRRESGIRAARSMKHEHEYDHLAYGHRTEDDHMRKKYSNMADAAAGHVSSRGSKLPAESRPSMGRRASTRAVPPIQVRRSSALPKESMRSKVEIEEEEIFSRERERRGERMEREAHSISRERERRQAVRDSEPESPSSRHRESASSRHAYPPPLNHSNSSPPFAYGERRDPLPRTRTEPPQVKTSTPSMSRSQTMPAPAPNSSSKRAPQPSKLRRSVMQDDFDYSSSSEESDRPIPKTPAKPVRRTQTHVYMAQSSSDEKKKSVKDGRPSRQTRTVSPESVEPSPGAVKIANLAPKRPSGTHSRSSSHTVPMRTGRSPDRGARRERDRARERDYEHEEKLYGERSQRPPLSPRRDTRAHVSYSKPIRDEDIVYGQYSSGRRDRDREREREREREPYHGYPHPGLQRSFSIPIHTMSQ